MPLSLPARTLKVWNLSIGKPIASFTSDGSMIACAIAPDGRTIVAGDASGRVHCLRLERFEGSEPIDRLSCLD